MAAPHQKPCFAGLHIINSPDPDKKPQFQNVSVLFSTWVEANSDWKHNLFLPFGGQLGGEETKIGKQRPHGGRFLKCWYKSRKMAPQHFNNRFLNLRMVNIDRLIWAIDTKMNVKKFYHPRKGWSQQGHWKNITVFNFKSLIPRKRLQKLSMFWAVKFQNKVVMHSLRSSEAVMCLQLSNFRSVNLRSRAQRQWPSPQWNLSYFPVIFLLLKKSPLKSRRNTKDLRKKSKKFHEEIRSFNLR